MMEQKVISVDILSMGDCSGKISEDIEEADIYMCDKITIIEVMSAKDKHIKGIVCTSGTIVLHGVGIARELKIPCFTIDQEQLQYINGRYVEINGTLGMLRIIE